MYICNAQSNMMLGVFLNESEINIAELHQVTLQTGRCMAWSLILGINKWTSLTYKDSTLNVLKSVGMAAVAQVLCVYDNNSGYFVSSVISKQD